ncbi:MAG: AIR synthase-related protein [Chloroflexota bacterium]
MAAERYATEARSAERRYGGLLETLLGVACRSEVGIGIDVAQLPALPIVSRFAEALQLDRLRMISSGTLVATVLGEHTDGVRKALQALRVPFAFAGRVTGGSGVRVL